MPLTQQQAHSAMGNDALLHEKTLSVVLTTDLDNTILPLFTQSINSNLHGHAPLIEGIKFVLIAHFNELWTPSAWEEGDTEFHLDMAD